MPPEAPIVGASVFFFSAPGTPGAVFLARSRAVWYNTSVVVVQQPRPSVR